jgi:CRP-like cAMP-binding protein
VKIATFAKPETVSGNFMNDITTYFNKIGIEEKDLQPFLAFLQVKTYTKGEIILYNNQTDNYLSFLKSGIISFFVENDGKDATFDFIFPNSFYCHYDSFYSRKATQFNSEALADSEIYRIHYNDLHSLFNTCEYAKDLSRIAVEKLLEKKVNREILLLTKSPKERYLSLLNEHPKLVQLIPQKYLATYLGVVPETLSRIRSRIS